MQNYDPKLIEAKWQREWASQATSHKPQATPYYVLEMFPYPSGKIHMGHVRNYAIGDVIARMKAAQGFEVLHPMGWDAFGLPAENAAMEKKVHPAKWTYENIASMREQLKSIGLAYDWDREIATCHPDYYKHEQAFFLDFLENGLAYRKEAEVNWDPVDNTVLANEQVIDGRGWRSGVPVEKREIPGYYLAITQYADELLAGVTDATAPNYLEGWPERVRLMQEHWIGKSEGVRFAFPHTIRSADGELVQGGKLWVFTTRVATIKGVTFCAVAPEHPLAMLAAQGNADLGAFIEDCKKGGTTEA